MRFESRLMVAATAEEQEARSARKRVPVSFIVGELEELKGESQRRRTMT